MVLVYRDGLLLVDGPDSAPSRAVAGGAAGRTLKQNGQEYGQGLERIAGSLGVPSKHAHRIEREVLEVPS